MGLKERGSKRKQLAKTFLGIFLAVFILGFVLNFVDINQNPPVTGLAFLDFESDIIQPWQEGSLDIVVARYLFFILALIFLYSMLGMLGDMNPFIRFIAGLILAFLFTGYIVPGDLLAVMTTYSGLGITMIAVIPPLILMLLTTSILTSKRMGAAGSAILQRFLWGFYFVFMVYSTFRFWGTSQGSVDISNPVLLILLFVTLFSFAVFIWNSFYLQFITNTLVGVYKARIKAGGSEKEAKRAERLVRRKDEQMEMELDNVFGKSKRPKID